MSDSKLTEEELQKLLSEIYTDLKENSVDMDEECKRILYDNLWELYV